MSKQTQEVIMGFNSNNRKTKYFDTNTIIVTFHILFFLRLYSQLSLMHVFTSPNIEFTNNRLEILVL